MLSANDQKNQARLKAELQDDDGSTKLENLAAALIGRLLGVSIAVAKSGFQHGADAGTAGRQGRRLRVECKKYGDKTALDERELLGEVEQALQRDPALEAWILVTTREVPEQLAQSLYQKGEASGLPIVILDWPSRGLADLAALCASAPDLVGGLFSSSAGTLAQALQPACADAVERLKRDLQHWSLGFEVLRARSVEKLEQIWRFPPVSNAALGQDAAGGARDHKIRRQAVYDALERWWSGAAREVAPVAVVGPDGVGKTWATLDWLVDRQKELPIVLAVPSSAAPDLGGISKAAVKQFLADRLYDLAGVRDRDYWLRRLDNLLKRPPDEGPVLTVFFDGLNQEPSAGWLQLLKVLQDDPFADRVRVILSTRSHHYEIELANLCGLLVPAVVAPVDVYDLSPGGELDQMLAFETLTRERLHPDLIPFARVPRLFHLVVRFRERPVETGQVTVHRLLWEYGRDSLGARAGRSFSEGEWRAWLREIASQYRRGIREFSLKSLGETVNRPDLTAKAVYARLSDIVDGRFTIGSTATGFELIPTVVAHALGAALLATLDAITSPTFDSVNVELTGWLDPIAGLDERAEILRAAVSIYVERGGANGSPVCGVLVTSWLQTQNVPDAHRHELASLAASLRDALLDAVEHSANRTHASARLWAVNALRAIDRSDMIALSAIVERTRRWNSVVSRGVEAQQLRDADFEKRRSQHFLTRVGIDASGSRQVLGLRLEFIDRDDGILASTVASVLEGFPLAAAVPAFEAAAIALAITRDNAGWDSLKWLCLLNEVDPAQTTSALRALSEDVAARPPEAGVNLALPARAASLLLRLTGQEEDESTAAQIDPGLDRLANYQNDYLAQPGRSLFALERRHAYGVLSDTSLSVLSRAERCRELWLDPTFEPPASYVAEVREVAPTIEVENLDRHSSVTIEEHRFETFEPVLARCAPDLLADLIRRKLHAYRACPAESRYWSAIRATDHLLLVGDEEADAARTLRRAGREKAANYELYTASQLLILEIHGRDALQQVDEIVDAGLEDILVDLAEVLKPLTPDQAETLVNRFSMETTSQIRNLVILLGLHKIALSDNVWTWLTGIAFDSDLGLRRCAFRTLAKSDAERFGRDLLARNWSWSPEQDHWVNHYGSGALIGGSTGLPFDQIAPRLAPWRLLEAARLRGANPSEVRLAATIFGRVLAAEHLGSPDPGADISVDRTDRESGESRFSVTPTQSHAEVKDSVAALKAALDAEAQLHAYRRAAEVAVERIREARQSGASLYLAHVDVDDLRPVLRHVQDSVEVWLNGADEGTDDFKRRVRLAEGAYLALCEALLEHDPPRGASLWRSLRQVLGTRFVGEAGVDEIVHIAFRAPDSPTVEELRAELIGLDHCHTDQALLNLVIAAKCNGKSLWLSKLIAEDNASALAWRRRRGVVLEGFESEDALPLPEAWPDGEIKTGHEALRCWSARFRYREACARHWWHAYLAAEDTCQAYASWILFLRSADRRAWLWAGKDARENDDGSSLYRVKITHARVNRSKLQRAMEKREDKLEGSFLNRKTVDGLAPWSR